MPGVAESLARKVVSAVNRLRQLDLAKPPGVAETLDWVRTLDVLGEADLTPEAAEADTSARSSRSATTSRSCAATSTRSPAVPDRPPSRGALLGVLAGFGQALRDGGCPRHGRPDHAAAALGPLDPTDVIDLYWAGRTSLAPRRDEMPVYDAVFRAYFLGEADDDAIRVPRTSTPRQDART